MCIGTSVQASSQSIGMDIGLIDGMMLNLQQMSSVRRGALKNQLSAHSKCTARGGGLACMCIIHLGVQACFRSVSEAGHRSISSIDEIGFDIDQTHCSRLE